DEEVDVFELLGEVYSNIKSWGFSEIVDISLEREPKYGHLGSIGFGDRFFNLINDPLRLAIVDISSCPNELGILRVGGDNEPRIYCNAMSTNTWAGLENVHAGVVVR